MHLKPISYTINFLAAQRQNSAIPTKLKAFILYNIVLHAYNYA